MKLPKLSLANSLMPIRRPQPALAVPDGSIMFASGGSDDDGYDGYDDDPGYDEPAQSTRRAPGAPRGASGGPGGPGDGGGGRRRTVQFQPEDRYWTEYLRIALPIIGLLLMIGLFWYWASQLADGDDGEEPTSTQAPGATELITPDATPTPTEQIITQPTQAPAETPADEADSTPETEEPAEEEPTEEPEDAGEATEGDFEPNQAVIVTDDGDGLNMRAEASTDAEPLTTLEAGTVLEIQSGPIEADGYIWWEVIVSDTGEAGFVAQRSVDDPDVVFIEPAE